MRLQVERELTGKLLALRGKYLLTEGRPEGQAELMLGSLSTILVAGLCIGCSSEFQPPMRLKAAGVPIWVENPDYAAPCWADIDGDGKKDLLVGQFSSAGG